MLTELKGYRNLSNLTGVTHKTPKRFENVVRVFLLYLAVMN